MATSLNNLAALYQAQGKYGEAEPLYQAGPGHQGKGPGAGAPGRGHQPQQPGSTLSMPRGSTGRRSRCTSGPWPSGKRPWGRSTRTWRTASTTWQDSTATRGSTRRRSRYSSGPWRSVEKALGPEHPNVATCLENYAALLKKMGRGAEAEPLEARARAIRAKHAEKNPQK